MQSGYLEVVKLLLERGANSDLYVASPLYRAVEDNQRDIITLLLKYSVGPQTAALKLAVLRGDENMVRFLLDSEFRVREYGCAALYAAKMKGDRDMVGLLESRGATLGLLGEGDRGRIGMRRMGMVIGVLVVCLLCLSMTVMRWLRRVIVMQKKMIDWVPA